MNRNKRLIVSESLSVLIAQQLLLIAEAKKDKEDTLSSLMACQLFDTLDWARLNLKEKSLEEISAKVYSQVPSIPMQKCGLEHIEKYAESTLSGK